MIRHGICEVFLPNKTITPMLFLFNKKAHTTTAHSLLWQPMSHLETERDKALSNKIAYLFEKDLGYNERINGLHFYVQNGEITVKGTMGSINQKNEILRILSSLSNVKLVRDEIQIGFKPQKTKS